MRFEIFAGLKLRQYAPSAMFPFKPTTVLLPNPDNFRGVMEFPSHKEAFAYANEIADDAYDEAERAELVPSWGAVRMGYFTENGINRYAELTEEMDGEIRKRYLAYVRAYQDIRVIGIAEDE
jgi:hypothetical protein